MFAFVHSSQPQARFIRRMLVFFVGGAIADAIILLIGTIGFRLTLSITWLDALVDAALVFTGNGPRQVADQPGGKVFLVLYTIISCTAFVVVVALVMTPALHRFLQLLHVKEPDEPEE